MWVEIIYKDSGRAPHEWKWDPLSFQQESKQKCVCMREREEVKNKCCLYCKVPDVKIVGGHIYLTLTIILSQKLLWIDRNILFVYPRHMKRRSQLLFIEIVVSNSLNRLSVNSLIFFLKKEFFKTHSSNCIGIKISKKFQFNIFKHWMLENKTK